MSLWVKICGNSSLADAELAASAGADAVGFVFAPSPRQVTAEQVRSIAPKLPASIEKIGVFVDSGLAEISKTVAECGLTGVQLHFSGAGSLPAQLRHRFGPALRILRVLHFGRGAAADLAAAVAGPDGKPEPALDAILVDSRTPAAVGGTGIAFDWQAARAQLFSGASGVKLVAAGGLTPANVARAVAILAPWGVDVSTGVESSPGKKSPEKVRAFLANAREAASGNPAR